MVDYILEFWKKISVSEELAVKNSEGKILELYMPILLVPLVTWKTKEKEGITTMVYDAFLFHE